MFAGAGRIVAGHAYVLIEAIDKTQAVMGSVTNRLDNFSRRITSLGVQTVALGAALLAPFVMAIRSATEFSDEILKLKAVLATSEGEFEKTKNVILELGRTTSFTATEVARAAVALGRADFNPQQIRASLKDVLNLARSGSLEMERAAEIMSQVMSVFGIEASKAGEIADKFFIASKRGLAEVDDMAVAFSYTAGTAADFGESLEDVLAILTVMSKGMLLASKGGTSLNRVFDQLVENRDKLAAIGVAVENPKTGNVRSVISIMKDLVFALRGASDVERLSFIRDVFDIRGARAARQFFRAIDEMEKVREELKKSGGEAAEAAKVMDSGLGGSIRRLISAFSDLKIKVGEALAPTFKKLEEVLIPLLQRMSAWVEQNPRAIQQAFALSAAVLSLGGGLVLLGGSLRLVSAALKGFNIVLSASKWILKLIVAMGATGGGIAFFAASLAFAAGVLSIILIRMRKYVEFQRGLNEMMEKFRMAWENIRRTAEPFLSAISIVWEKFKSRVEIVAKTIETAIAIGLGRALAAIGEFVLDASEWFVVLLGSSNLIWNTIAQDVTRVLIHILSNFAMFTSNISQLGENLWNNLKMGLIAFAGFFADMFVTLQRLAVTTIAATITELTRGLAEWKKAATTSSGSIEETIKKSLDTLLPTLPGGPLDPNKFIKIWGGALDDLIQDAIVKAGNNAIKGGMGMRGLQEGMKGLKEFEGGFGIPVMLMELIRRKIFMEIQRRRKKGEPAPALDKATVLGPEKDERVKKVIKDAVSTGVVGAFEKGTKEAAEKELQNRIGQQQLMLLGGIKKEAEKNNQLQEEQLKILGAIPGLGAI